MAIVKIQHGGVCPTNEGTNVVLTPDSVPEDGELILASVALAKKRSVTPPEGWTELGFVQGPSFLSLWLGWKIAQDEPGSYTFIFGGTTERDAAYAVFTGANQDGFVLSSDDSSGTTYTCPSIEQSVKNKDWVLRICVTKYANGFSVIPDVELIHCPTGGGTGLTHALTYENLAGDETGEANFTVPVAKEGVIATVILPCKKKKRKNTRPGLGMSLI